MPGAGGARTGARSQDVTTWATALEEMSGYADDLHRTQYAHKVFALLARGGTFMGRDGESVRVDFVLDKAMPPSGPDIRELGVVVISIGLESK